GGELRVAIGDLVAAAGVQTQASIPPGSDGADAVPLDLAPRIAKRAGKARRTRLRKHRSQESIGAPFPLGGLPFRALILQTLLFRALVLHAVQQPGGLLARTVGADQSEPCSAERACAGERADDLVVAPFLELDRAAVPDGHGAGAVLAARDLAVRSEEHTS